MTPEEQAALEAAKAAANATPAGTAGDDASRQAALNQQFAERAKRAEEATRKALWEAIGVKTQEEWDAFVNAKKEAEDANKTALEKAQSEAAKAKEEADKLKSESQTALEKAHKRIVDGEIKLIAAREAKKDEKVTRPEALPEALDIILLVINREEIKDEDGKVTGIEKALDDLYKEKPILFKAIGTPAPAGRGSPPPPRQPNQPQQPAKPTRVVGSTL